MEVCIDFNCVRYGIYNVTLNWDISFENVLENNVIWLCFGILVFNCEFPIKVSWYVDCIKFGFEVLLLNWELPFKFVEDNSVILLDIWRISLIGFS